MLIIERVNILSNLCRWPLWARPAAAARLAALVGIFGLKDPHAFLAESGWTPAQ